jgi:NADH-quinone oxidoreductase subunit G
LGARQAAGRKAVQDDVGAVAQGASTAAILPGEAVEALAQVKEQWPIVGRSDMYYGGTTYENTKGMGVQLVPVAQAGGAVRISKVRKEAALRPKEKELLAVPSNKLYDLGVTVQTAEFLEQRIGETKVAMHPTTAKKFEVEAGQTVKLSFEGVQAEAVVKIDETIGTGVVLVPRGMGIAIHEPVVARVQAKSAAGKVK